MLDATDPTTRAGAPAQRSPRVPFLPAMLAAVAATLWLPLPSAAAPGVVGTEIAAEDIPIPASGWWSRCTDGRGVTVSVRRDCDGRCRGLAHIVVERSDRRGRRIGSATRVTEKRTNSTGARVTCDRSGSFAVTWVQSTRSEHRYRSFDREGRPLGPPASTLARELECQGLPILAVDPSGAVAVACVSGRGEDHVAAARISAAGVQIGDVAIMSQSEPATDARAKVAVDEVGTAFVVWTKREDGEPRSIMGRFLDASGQPVGDELRINTFAHGSSTEPAVRAESAGTFLVLWSNSLQGGRVGRRVSVDVEAAPVTTSTSTTLPSGFEPPTFGAARLIDSWLSTDGSAHEPRLDRGDDGTWLLGEIGGAYRASRDEGRRWSTPTKEHSEGRGALAVGTDGAGTLVALHTEGSTLRLDASRSLDGGTTWTRPVRVARTASLSEGCDHCTIERAVVVVAGAGRDTWLAAWTAEDFDGEDRGSATTVLEQLHVSRSTDGGARWRTPSSFDTAAAGGASGFDLATDGRGTWILGWTDGDVHVARSTDDGRHWLPQHVVAEDVICSQCAGHRRYKRIGMATDGAGVWMIVFAAPALLTEDYGHDSDIFIVLSTDNGATWSAPAPVAGYAGRDGARELDPAIATDRDGRWLVVWTSHRPAPGRGGADLDPDIVFSVSSDTGRSWSAPTKLDPGADRDAALDHTPHVAAAGGGPWMVSWQSRPLGVDDESRGLILDGLLVAAADATCGDGEIDVAEQCDDGDLVDGDGCDSNCTVTACHNGIATDGEDCDDANERDDDACVLECRAATCGDGLVFEPLEECDDANLVTSDACPTSCMPARCGDGFLRDGVEQCDDGNTWSGDECTAECEPARCGDGHVLVGAERCDDGNTEDGDDCPADCDPIECGDGRVTPGYEECDWGDPAQADICTDDCTLVSVCGDANGDGRVTVSDIRRILTRGVGVDVSCPRAACDMDASGAVRVPDAQIGLATIVGIDVGERCSLGTGEIVFWTDDTRSIGALQIEVDYGSTGGDFLGSGQDVGCTPLGGQRTAKELEEDLDEGGVPEGLIGFMAFNDIEDEGRLIIAMTAVQGMQGPFDIVRCSFTLPDGTSGVRLGIRIMDASDPSTQALLPVPRVGYRVE